mgnify:FL=1
MNTCRELRKLGFSRDTYGETVTIFYGDYNDIINVMPMGFKLYVDEESCGLTGRVFRGSMIYDLINSKGLSEVRCSICITKDPRAFYYSIFRKRYMIDALKRGVPNYCDAFINGTMVVSGTDDDSIRVIVRLQSVDLITRNPRVFDRASAAIIEALVWYTKIPYVSCNKVRQILDREKFYLETVRRSSRKGIYRRMINDIYARARELASTRCGSGNKDL